MVDHFIVIDQLGEGGMGVVLHAYDPDLHRRVALKLLPADTASGETTVRLFREAQAMARLSHPNVATIYEVGLVDDQVFLAMELIDGVTLDDWLGDEQRPTDELLGVFAGAGAGLAAAHAAGLVHRDFKPTNVVIDSVQRPRVLDFGLARPAPRAAQMSAPDTTVDAQGPLDQTITHAGAVLGTPAYMSPEQYLGQAVDARSDQFSFCVVLYEAFWGRRPFDTKTLPDLTADDVKTVLEVQPKRETPAAVRRAVERGLQPRRRDRFESMAELLTALQPAPRRGRQLLALVGMSAVTAVSLLVLWASSPHSGDVCPNPIGELTGIWDGARKAAIKRGFRSTKRPYARKAFDNVTRALDDYTARWLIQRRAACVATHVRKQQSAQLLDLRNQCLDRRLAVVASLSRQFADNPSGDVVDHAREAVARLPSLDYCKDGKALTAVLPPPADAATRAAVRSFREAIDRARALARTGRYKPALAMMRPLMAQIEATGYKPVIAEARLILGILEGKDGRPKVAAPLLRKAAIDAAWAKHDRVAAEAWIQLLNMLSHNGDFVAALALVPMVKAGLARAGAEPALWARFHDTVGLIYSRKGDYKAARPHHERARAMLEKTVGKDNLEYSHVLNHLGLNSWRLGKLDDAIHLFKTKLALDRRLFGELHPTVVRGLNNLGLVYKRKGNLKAAKKRFLRAIDIADQAVGAGHPLSTWAHENVGIVYAQMGDYAAALRHHRRALDIRIKTYGRDHPDVARSLEGIGAVYWFQGKLDKARPYYAEALSIRKRKLPADHPLLARTTRNLAALLAMTGRFSEALPHFREVLRIRRAKLGDHHTDVAQSWLDIGMAYIGLKRYADARANLEQALEIYRTSKADKVWIGDVQQQLAIALLHLGQRNRAALAAAEALAIYKAAGKRRDHDRRELLAWKRKNRLP